MPICPAPETTTSLPKAGVKAQPQRLNCLPSQQHEPYVTNVASTRNGIGYGYWAHIDGWSEAVVEYIRELERSAD